MTWVFYCSLPLQERERFICVSIEPTAIVAEIRRAIHTKLPVLGDYFAFHFYKTNLSIQPSETRRSRILQWLKDTTNNRSELDEAKPVSELFPDGPHVDGELHIIVVNDEILEEAKTLGDSPATYERNVRKSINQLYDSLGAQLELSSSLSDIIKSPTDLRRLLDDDESDPSIHLGRPGGIPAVLFSPAFARLKQRLDNLDTEGSQTAANISPSLVKDAHKLLTQAVSFCTADDENNLEEIRFLFGNLLGDSGLWAPNWVPVRPCASWWHRDIPTILLEFRNELGFGGDALTHALLVYSKLVSNSKLANFRGSCTFPCILISSTANHISVAGSICLGRVYTTKLFSLDLTLGFHSSDNVIRLARVFDAISTCRKELNIYYESILNQTGPELSNLFPNPTPYLPSVQMPSLEYKSFLSSQGLAISTVPNFGIVTTALYLAKLRLHETRPESDWGNKVESDVIVKFTSRYNASAHHLLASSGYAPKLHFCQLVVADPKLYMVVMNRVVGNPLWNLLQGQEMDQSSESVHSEEDTVSFTPAIAKAIYRDISAAVQLLHSEGWVFGDLRIPNILWITDSDPGSTTDGVGTQEPESVSKPNGRAVLIDFDWAGKDGESRYGATLNVQMDIKWAPGVGPYEVMKKQHDLWQLEWLRRDLTLYS